MESENLIQLAADNGAYLMQELNKIEAITHVRGKGLMIGFDVPDAIRDLKKKLLSEYHIFTGEAKPNVIRLLPSLAISRQQINDFLDALKKAITS
jgi:acetylornithine aminotransferase